MVGRCALKNAFMPPIYRIGSAMYGVTEKNPCFDHLINQ